MKTSINIDGKAQRAEIRENNHSWGNGISVTVFDDNDDTLYEFHACNHPDFDNFEEYQSMDLWALVDVVKKKFESNQYNMDDLQKAKEAGLTIFLGIN